jgi:hypothetical protein
MSNKFTIQALALAGILAVSGLPALAADMTPATPAPGAAVHSDVKSGVSGAGSAAAVGTNAKADAKILPGDKKDSKDVSKETKAKDAKDIHSDAKDIKKQPEQSAKLPATAAPSVPAPTSTVNGAVGTKVQH